MSTPARHVAAVRSLGPWAVALVVLAGLCASVLAASLSGAVAPPPGGLSDAGPVGRWALPPIRLVHDVAAALTVGTLVLAATMVPGATRQASAALEEPRRAAALRIATASAFVWAIAGVVVVIFTFADASGLALGDPLRHQELRESLDRVDRGIRLALLVRAVQLLVVGKRVRIGPDHLRMDERRAFTLAAILDRVLECSVGSERVGTIDLLFE